MDLDKAIKSRRSVRKFKSKKPDWRSIVEAIDSARYAPMAGNNYTPKFILVDDFEKIKKIADSAQQDFLKNVQYIVVVCSDPKRTINAYGEKGKNYCRQQAGAAIQNFLLKLVEKGLSACWVGHFEESQIKRILKIPAEINVESVIPIGHALEKPKEKRKIELDNVLYFNTYKQNKMKSEKKLNV